MINGSGPIPCDYMLVGSQPGFEEQRKGRVFVGHTGRELDRYLDGADLPARDDIFLTNLFREFKGKEYVYTQEDREIGTRELRKELARVRPKHVIVLGRDATRWFLGDVDMEDVHGIPWFWDEQPDVVILPCYHVAAGLHNPEINSFVAYDFAQCAEYFAGRLHPRRLFDDPIKEPHYEEIISIEQLQSRLQRLPQGAPIAIDTEGYPGDPWSLQFSFEPGTAYLIGASATPILRHFGAFLAERKPRLVYHSALHDIGRMRELGLPTDLDFDDTMTMAYLLQIEPQGLKPLCTRHCNMRMQSYDDIVGDSQQRIALDYMQGLWDIEQLEWEERCQDVFWQEIEKGRRISKIPALPKTALHKSVTRCLQSKDTYKLWENQLEDIRVAGYNRLGEIPKATLDHVERSVAVHYGCRDADGTTRLRPEMAQRLVGLGLEGIYNLDISTYPIIERMSYIGLKPDLTHFAQLSTRLASEIEQIRARLVAATDNESFNANSGDQVAAYLFDHLGIEPFGRRLQSGRFSTDDKILEALEYENPEHAIISDIRDYRSTYKLKHTFVDRLPDHLRRWPFDGRIHATFRTTRVVTGRLAAADPNLYAQPKDAEDTAPEREFRRGWISDDGHVIISHDLSQIELRVGAHLAQDPYMLKVFRGEVRNKDGSFIDLHAGLGQRIFGLEKKDQTKAQRTSMKAINFGFWMGQTAKGLQVELRRNGVYVTEDDAQRWLDEANALYKGAQPFKDQCIAEARRNGYIRCMSGRIRYIGGIRSRDERIRSESERFAFSTKIQEGAQYIGKAALAWIWQHVILPAHGRGEWVEPLLWVHDDFVCEAEERLAPSLHTVLVHAMTKTFKGLSVPIETSGDFGRTWAASDMQSFENA